MKEFIEYIIKNLIDQEHHEHIHVNEVHSEKTMVIEIKVNQTDIGKIIGKKGRTIHAIRTLAISVATRHGWRVVIEVIEPEKVV